MSAPTFHPRHIDLPFGNGDYRFALPAVQLAELQEARGWKVNWPDGSHGIRRKPFGLIWREHATGEYDPADSREIIRLALVGGEQGWIGPKGSRTEVKVSAVVALDLLDAYFDPMPTDEQWKLATAVLSAVTQGYKPPATEDAPPGEDGDAGNAEGGRSTTGESTSPASSETASPAD